MTITQILDSAKNNLNASSDTYWSTTELLYDLYQIELELVQRTTCIESTATDVSIAATAEYTIPTRALEISRVTYNGAKLQKISLREFDSINPNSTTSSGTPAYYLQYGSTITLYPTPATSALTIKYWFYKEPAEITATSDTLEVPSVYHDALVAGLTYRMCLKDTGHPLTAMWKGHWDASIARVENHIRRKRRGDRFSVAKTEEEMLTTDFGII